MPTINGPAIKCAELFWMLESCQLEYRCVSCVQCFDSHADCFHHIQSCVIQQDTDAECKDVAQQNPEMYSQVSEFCNIDEVKEGNYNTRLVFISFHILHLHLIEMKALNIIITNFKYTGGKHNI